MKIHIIYQFKDGPWGGANQFLKTLRNEFIRLGIYTLDIKTANIIVFNSHHLLNDILNYKKQYPKKTYIHRVDGPIQLIRGHNDGWDDLLVDISNRIANGVVYQSKWSRNKLQSLTNMHADIATVISNAPDPTIFKVYNQKNKFSKRRLIATSFSSNPNKGFEFYQYLDEHLNFDKYQMTFVGNSPCKFKNIVSKSIMHTTAIADELHKHQIYITASKNDPCSNALIEALHCGLPAVALNSGGHPEIIEDGGELFSNPDQMIDAIQKVDRNYLRYKQEIHIPDIKQIAQQYVDFFKEVKSHQHQKILNTSVYLTLKTRIYTQYTKSKIRKNI
jgi:glycosyltransferase involved in cell wall biosynthesis